MELKIDHVNISFKNLEDSIAWYKNVFAFEVVVRDLFPVGTKRAILNNNDFMICLAEFANFENSLHWARKVVEQPNCQIHHFGIRITDLEQWKKQIEKYSLKLNYGGAVQYKNSTSWYIQDPSGHEIEVSYSGKLPLYTNNSTSI